MDTDVAEAHRQQEHSSRPAHDIRDVSPPSSTHQVLHTTELLEAILLELDMQTLLLSQRVSRMWHDLIRTSTPLQKKLWFIPDDNFQAHSSGLEDDDLCGNFNSFLVHKLFDLDTNYRNADQHIGRITLLVRRDVERCTPAALPTSYLPDSRTVIEANVTFKKGMHKHDAATESWGRMLLYQSPDATMRWDINIAWEPPLYIRSKQGCVTASRHTRFYDPKALDRPPTMAFLLGRASEKRKAWLAARKKQHVGQRIRENKIGQPRYLFSHDFHRTMALMAITVLAVPILIPLGIYVRGKRLVKQHRQKGG